MSHIAPRPLEHDATAAWLGIRRLEPTERGALARHLLALPYEDRCARFDGVMGDGAIVAHCAALDLARDGDVVATAAWKGAEIVGAALAWIGPRHDAEIAVTVAPEHRRRRLASHLVAHVCDTAARQGATRALFQFRPSNIAVANLVRHLGGVADRAVGAGEVPIGVDAR